MQDKKKKKKKQAVKCMFFIKNFSKIYPKKLDKIKNNNNHKKFLALKERN